MTQSKNFSEVHVGGPAKAGCAPCHALTPDARSSLDETRNWGPKTWDRRATRALAVRLAASSDRALSVSPALISLFRQAWITSTFRTELGRYVPPNSPSRRRSHGYWQKVQSSSTVISSTPAAPWTASFVLLQARRGEARGGVASGDRAGRPWRRTIDNSPARTTAQSPRGGKSGRGTDLTNQVPPVPSALSKTWRGRAHSDRVNKKTSPTARWTRFFKTRRYLLSRW